MDRYNERYEMPQSARTNAPERLLMSVLGHPQGSYTGERFPGTVPCSDGWMGLNALGYRNCVRLCQLMEREDLLEDPRFNNSAGRRKNGMELLDAAIPWSIEHSKWDILCRGGGDIQSPGYTESTSAPKRIECGGGSPQTRPGARSFQVSVRPSRRENADPSVEWSENSGPHAFPGWSPYDATAARVGSRGR